MALLVHGSRRVSPPAGRALIRPWSVLWRGRFTPRLFRIGLFAWILGTLALAAPSHAQNPAVVYVHGVSENACAPGNMRDVLRVVGERLPQTGFRAQGGAACRKVQPGENPLRFRYVQDKHEANDEDKGFGRGGSSQSGARRNATALRDYIDRLTEKGEGKVMLVGFSMGGLIIRTYLSDHRGHANEKVAGVVFIESALQGSLFGLAAKAANASEARRVCEAQDSFPGGSTLCLGLLSLIRQEFELENEDAIAFRDLSPASEIVRQNASATPPEKPRYLTVPGDIRLRLPRNALGEWVFGRPNEELPVGDGVIPVGDSDPGGTPPLGGASFKPQGYHARLSPLIRTCGIANRDLQLLVDAFLVGSALDTKAKLECLRAAPEAHWNINARSGEIRPDREMALPQLVSEFLVDACRAARLGRCGPEPLVGRGGSCGVLKTGKTWRGPYHDKERPISLDVKVEIGQVRCSEARSMLLWYVNADNPCINAGNTCALDRGYWTCSAPTAGAYPVLYRCTRNDGVDVTGSDAVGPAARATISDCGDPPGTEAPGPYEVRANITCAEALEVARVWGVGCDGPSCEIRGFTCRSRPTGIESFETRCTWGDRVVTFVIGA